MIFPSIGFLFFFFPIFLFAYALLPCRNFVILTLSLLFYVWGEGEYVVLLLSTVAINYFVGKFIVNKAGVASKKILSIGLIFNLSILIFFKYWTFLCVDILSFNVTDITAPRLPLGISFFIFQSISYLIDVYRKESKSSESIFDLTLYIVMFPQLIAGPIVRYSTVASSIRKRFVEIYQIRDGILFFIGGLSQKVLIANHVGEIADAAFKLPLEQINSSVAWIGALSYSLQIFFDFSGYSCMAIGIGLIMGFQFPVNFNYPYISNSITEFWRRWHISLSTWFRDYVYIPLGGNRKGSARTYINLFIVFFLCGLWHGAAWTFVIWGIYHGILLISERVFLKNYLSRLPAFITIAYTQILVMIGWIFFRAESFVQAKFFIFKLFNIQELIIPPALTGSLTRENLIYFVLGIILSTPITPWILKKYSVLPQIKNHQKFNLIGAIAISFMSITMFTISCVYIYAGTYNPFIYFRF